MGRVKGVLLAPGAVGDWGGDWGGDWNGEEGRCVIVSLLKLGIRTQPFRACRSTEESYEDLSQGVGGFRFDGCKCLCDRCCCAGGAGRCKAFFGYALARDWTDARGAGASAGRSAEPAGDVLLRDGERRSVEDDRCGSDMAEPVGLAADGVDRIDCGCGLRSECGVCGERGRTAAAGPGDRGWGLQVDRCGEDVGTLAGAAGWTADRPGGDRSEGCEQGVCGGDGASVWAE